MTKHSSVYNGGIIGTGRRKSISYNNFIVDNIPNNITQLIRMIKACCLGPQDSEKDTEILQDSIIQVSLLLVQYISPDVMYNGLPWPEEEFSKVTIERDLFIRRLFTSTPLLWELLSLVAIHRPALCYCSVIIRALTATLMHQWSSMGDQSKSADTESYKSLMDTTIKVIEIMSLGQLLPPPLSGIRDVISYFNSFEVVFKNYHITKNIIFLIVDCRYIEGLHLELHERSYPIACIIFNRYEWITLERSYNCAAT